MRGPWIEVEYVRPYVEMGVKTYGTLEGFAQAANCTARRLYSVMSGESSFVEFDKLDNILTTLNQEYLFHVPAKDGGFEDVLIMKQPRIPCDCGAPHGKYTEGCEGCVKRLKSRDRNRSKRERAKQSPTN